MEEVLIKIAKEFNKQNITWAMGSSYLLKEKGLVDICNDLDFFVSLEDIQKVKEILDILGEREESPFSKNFKSKVFLEYNVDNVEIDVMAGFTVIKDNHIYEYILDDKAIVESKIKEDTKIYYTSLEDWFVIYQLIDGREEKVLKIKEKLLNTKNINRFLLKRNLSLSIPKSVKVEIKNILNN